MDKKLLLYLLILGVLVTATAYSVLSSKRSDSSLSNIEMELLEDTGHFEIDPAEDKLLPLFGEGTTLTNKELGDGGEPSSEVLAAYNKFAKTNKDTSPFISFALFVLTGIFTGFLIVTYILPNIAQRASEEVIGSSEKTEGPNALSRAQAFVAQGEWEQAIAAFREAAVEDPTNRLPWIEIAMLQRERLENPPLAIQTLDQALARGDWRENDETFFLFRKIEIYENTLKQHPQAIALLRDIIERFPQTRHSANAMHKLHEFGES